MIQAIECARTHVCATGSLFILMHVCRAVELHVGPLVLVLVAIFAGVAAVSAQLALSGSEVCPQFNESNSHYSRKWTDRCVFSNESDTRYNEKWTIDALFFCNNRVVVTIKICSSVF